MEENGRLTFDESSEKDNFPSYLIPLVFKKHILALSLTIMVLCAVVVAGAIFFYAEKPSVQQNTRITPYIYPNPVPSVAVSTAGWNTYTNAQFGYAIIYPRNWYPASNIGSPVISYSPSSEIINFYISRTWDKSQKVIIPVSVAVFSCSSCSSRAPFNVWLDKGYRETGIAVTREGTIFDALARAYTGKKGIVSYASRYGAEPYIEIGLVRTHLFYTRYIPRPGTEYVYAVEIQFDFNKNDSQWDIPDRTVASVFNRVLSSFTFLPITPVSKSPPQTTCNTSSDCPSGESCEVVGPIIAGQPIRKTCIKQGEAQPL